MDCAVFNEKVRCPEPRGLVRERLERQLLDPGRALTALILGPPWIGQDHPAESGAPLRPGCRAAGTGPPPEDDQEPALVRHLASSLGAALNTEALLGRHDGRRARYRAGVAGRTPEPAGPRRHSGSVAGTGAERALERFLSLAPAQPAYRPRQPTTPADEHLSVAGERRTVPDRRRRPEVSLLGGRGALPAWSISSRSRRSPPLP